MWRAVRSLLLALWAAGAAALCAAQDVQPVPVLTGRVIDQVGVLDASQRSALEARLAAFEREAGPQIVVLVLATTAPEDIAAYAQRVADAWRIGRRDVGDGLLIVVARDDRRVRIEVAKALEGAVPDLAARQVIDRQIKPAFQKGDFAGGLQAGVEALMARIRGEHLPAPAAGQARADAARDGLDWGDLAMYLFVGVPVAGAVLTSVFGRKLGSVLAAGGTGAAAMAFGATLGLAVMAGVLALIMVGVLGVGSAVRGGRGGGRGGAGPIVWGGGGGGSSGSSDSGGFSSGGGGDFGGGGASGDW